MNRTTPWRALALALTCAGALALSACGSDDGSPSSGSSSSSAAATSAERPLAAKDMWTKATDEDMTAVFGELKNTSDNKITVVSVTTSASKRAELHETVEDESGQMKMQEKRGGFVIEPGRTLKLEPGADHIMILDVKKEVVAGTNVSVTVKLKDGSSMKYTAPAKDFAGGNETYDDDKGGDKGGMDMDGDTQDKDMEGMDHSSHTK